MSRAVLNDRFGLPQRSDKVTDHTRPELAGLAILAVLLLLNAGRPLAGATCKRCGWAPPRTSETVTVRRSADLAKVVARARPSTTILLEDGTYFLDQMLDVAVPGLVLRGRSGDRPKVVVRGEGMTEQKVGVAFSISAPRVVLADLVIGAVRLHGVQVRGERAASDFTMHNVMVADAGQQLVKGSTGTNGKSADRGLVACSVFQYSDHAPSDYTNGVDILNGQGWVVRDNYFLRIRGPAAGGWSCGPTILFWIGSRDTVIERNLLVDCYRGIALGLVQRKERPVRNDGMPGDHGAGIIRSNIVCNLNPWPDEAIEVNDAAGVRVEHNTVLVDGKIPWSIGIRFPRSEALVRNNLTNHEILLRDGGRAEMRGNVTNARRDWFADPSRGILRLTGAELPAIDAGIPIEGVSLDFDRAARKVGSAPDAGAFEYRPLEKTPEPPDRK